MRTIPAREIKRRGISAVDGQLKEGPVYVIKSDEPRYVIMTLAHYAELRDAFHEATILRYRESIADYEAGRVTRWNSADEMIEALSLKEE